MNTSKVESKEVEVVVSNDTDHAHLVRGSLALTRDRNTFWREDSVEFARANMHFTATNIIGLREDYITAINRADGIPAKGDDFPAMSFRKHAVSCDSKANVTRNVAHALNLITATVLGKCTDAYFADTSFEEASQFGASLMETKGVGGGFVEGHKAHNSRHPALRAKGIDPATGLKMNKTQQKAYDDKMEKKQLEETAKATKAANVEAEKKLEESQKVEDKKVVHISDPDNKLTNMIGRLELAVDPKNAKVKGVNYVNLIKLVTELLPLIKPEVEVKKAA